MADIFNFDKVFLNFYIFQYRETVKVPRRLIRYLHEEIIDCFSKDDANGTFLRGNPKKTCTE